MDAEQASCRHADLPIAELDQLLDRRQPDAGAFVGAPARALDAMETVEDPRHTYACWYPVGSPEYDETKERRRRDAEVAA